MLSHRICSAVYGLVPLPQCTLFISSDFTCNYNCLVLLISSSRHLLSCDVLSSVMVILVCVLACHWRGWRFIFLPEQNLGWAFCSTCTVHPQPSELWRVHWPYTASGKMRRQGRWLASSPHRYAVAKKLSHCHFIPKASLRVLFFSSALIKT